jgi:hypothetical protein
MSHWREIHVNEQLRAIHVTVNHHELEQGCRKEFLLMWDGHQMITYNRWLPNVNRYVIMIRSQPSPSQEYCSILQGYRLATDNFGTHLIAILRATAHAGLVPSTIWNQGQQIPGPDLLEFLLTQRSSYHIESLPLIDVNCSMKRCRLAIRLTNRSLTFAFIFHSSPILSFKKLQNVIKSGEQW